MILAVTGGRDYRLTVGDASFIDRLIVDLRVTEFRHGGCRGADREAAAYVGKCHRHVRVEEYAAAWKDLGKAAGPTRNAAMLLGADALLAFPGGKGTADAVRKAKAARIEVYEAIAPPFARPAGGQKGGVVSSPMYVSKRTLIEQKRVDEFLFALAPVIFEADRLGLYTTESVLWSALRTAVEETRFRGETVGVAIHRMRVPGMRRSTLARLKKRRPS